MDKDIICVRRKLWVNPLKIPEIRIVWTIMAAMILGFGILVAILEKIFLSAYSLKIVAIFCMLIIFAYTVNLFVNLMAPSEICYNKQSKILIMIYRKKKKKLKLLEISMIAVPDERWGTTAVYTGKEYIPFFNGTGGKFGNLIATDFKRIAEENGYNVIVRKLRKLSIYRKYTSGKILFSEIDGDVIQIGRKIESLFNKLMILTTVYVILSTFICAYLSAVFKQEPILVIIAFPIFAPIYALILYMFVLTDPLQCFQILDKGIRILHIYTEKRFISKSDIEKFTLNTKKKRIEIQLKNGEKIVLRRGRREMKERFSEIRINELQNALRKLGVSYEIV